MKKTFIALLALAASAVANADTSAYMLDSRLNLADGTTLSAFDQIPGKTKNEVTGTGYFSAADQLHFTTLTLTLTLGDMYLSGADSLEGPTTISSISFISRPDSSNQGPGTITVSVGGQTYTSEDVTYSQTGATYGTDTFSFENAITIDPKTTTITLTLGHTNSVEVGFGAFQPATNATLTGSTAEYNGVWYPVVRISGTTGTPVVPEPATATLSLLALAGLAARRRRAL